MANTEIEKYITKRYFRWLDYAEFHCSRAGISFEANDVLNEVLISLLNKNEKKLLPLLHKKSGQYTELDYYVLRMIKLNSTSPTSPYRHKYINKIKVDTNTEVATLNIICNTEIEEDESLLILNKVKRIRKILDETSLDPFARKVFEFRFFHHESFSKWEGPESDKRLYSIYMKVVALLRDKISNSTMF